MATRKNQDAPPLPADTQPAGSGAVPGTEAAEPTFGETLKASAAGQQVQPGVNDGTDLELVEVAEVDTELADAAEEPMVTYHGGSTRREISEADWRQAGIQDMPLVIWERRTGYKVPKSVFTDQALQVLRQDQGFRVP